MSAPEEKTPQEELHAILDAELEEMRGEDAQVEAPTQADGPPQDTKTGEDGQDQAPTQAQAPSAADPYTVPEHLSKEARARFEHLVAEARREREARERIETQHRELSEHLVAAGADVTSIAQASQALRALQSQDPVELERALAYIEARRQEIATRLGKPIPGVDLLAQHPDLKAEVEAYQMTPERATEIARLREVERQHQETLARQSQEMQQAAHANQLMGRFETGKQAVNAVEAELVKSSPDYYQVRALMEPFLAPIARMYPPEQWAHAYRQLHGEVSERLNKMVGARQPSGPSPLPGSRAQGGLPIASGSSLTDHLAAELQRMRAGEG